MIGRLTTLEEIVKRFNPERFVESCRHLGSVVGTYSLITALKAELRFKSISIPIAVDEATKAETMQGYADFEKSLLESDLPMSAATVHEMVDLMSGQSIPDISISAPLAEELGRRLRDEMRLQAYYSVTPEEAKYYDSPWQGWEDVVKRFPDTTDDIEESSKCFALGRYAGSVFHSTQVIETGLIELGTFIGVTDPKSGWTPVTSALRKMLDKNYNSLTEFEAQHHAFLEQIHGATSPLQTAWRNKISHAQGRLMLMTTEFRREIAEEILVASRGFMRRLATELPAKGLRYEP